MTLTAALASFLFGSFMGLLGASLKLSNTNSLRWIGYFYTTVFRGVPEILVVYLFYFGSGFAVTRLLNLSGFPGFFSIPSFAIGVLSIGLVSGAYQTEVYRAAYRSVDKGQIEAGRAFGLSRLLLLRRITAPQTLLFALPALGNVWQSVLKETALLSVTGLIELLRQASTAAAVTRQPLLFYSTAAVIYFIIGKATGHCFMKMEKTLTYPRAK